MKHLRIEDPDNPNEIHSYSSPISKKKDKLQMKLGQQAKKATHQLDDQPPKRKWVIIIAVIVTAVVLLTSLIIIAVSIFANHESTIDPVQNTKVTQVTDNSVTLTWDKVSGANGYHIFQSDGGGDKFVQIAGVSDLTYTVTDLPQASKYSFCVKAFDGDGDSKEFTPVSDIWTLPKKVELLQVISEHSGEIYVEWTRNDKCDGYLLEFHTDGLEYRPENRVTIEQSATHSHTLTELIPNVTIGVRVTPYVINDDKTIYGAPTGEKSVMVTSMEKKRTTDHPMVAFTFDDGPLDTPSCSRILDILEANNAKATFFMIGVGCEKYPANLQRKASLGMELGNHSYDHKTYGEDLSAEDIGKSSYAILEATGQYPTAFRSPGGITTDNIIYECINEGLPLYYWSIDTRDWETQNADKIYHEVMDNVKDGDIILMHEIYDATADALEKIVPELIAQGYELVTCHDLVVAKTGEEPIPGKEYTSLS